MVRYNVIHKADIVAANRFDAEFFTSEYYELELLLSKVETTELGKLASSIKKGIFDISPSRYTEQGIPLVRTAQVKSMIANEKDLVFLTEDDHRKLYSKTELEPGDIVFTKVGSGIGDTAILGDMYAKYNFSQNVAGVSVKKRLINPWYLIAFLNCHFGRIQILRYMMPSGQGKLELRDIKKIQVPRLKEVEDAIAQMVYEAYQLISKSRCLYAETHHLLSKELGLEQIGLRKAQSYVVSYREVIESNRIDAQCYKPEYIVYEKHLRKRGKYDYMRNVLNDSFKGQQVKTLPDGDLGYVSIKDIEGVEIYSNEKCKKSAKLRTAERDTLLLAITGATIGKVGIVSRSGELAFSGDLLALKTNATIDPYYLLAVLSNPIGQSQCQRWVTGSTNGHLSPADVNRIVIPRLSIEGETLVAELLRASLRTATEGEKMLELAKRRVERMLED